LSTAITPTRSACAREETRPRLPPWTAAAAHALEHGVQLLEEGRAQLQQALRRAALDLRLEQQPQHRHHLRVPVAERALERVGGALGLLVVGLRPARGLVRGEKA